MALYDLNTPSLYADPSTRKSRAGRAQSSALPPEDKQSMLSALANQSGQFIETLATYLDTPGAIARGVLAGKPTSGFSFDAADRISGEELLDAYGLRPSAQSFGGAAPYLSTFAGLGAEIATDPLAWISGPLSAGGKAAKAAKLAKLDNLAPLVAQSKMGFDEAAKTLTGRFTKKSMEAAGVPLTQANLQARPLLGPRLSRSMVSLDEVVRASDDPKALEKAITAIGGPQEYAKYKDERLGGLLGVGFLNSNAAINPFGQAATAKITDALDLTGQAIGWSPMGRFASAAFDKRLAGTTSTADQVAALRAADWMEPAAAAGRSAATEHALRLSSLPMSAQAKALLGADSLFSPQGNDFLTKLVENRSLSPSETTLKAQIPGLTDWVNNWDMYRKQAIADAEALGLRSNDYQDRFKTLFSPRSGNEFDFSDLESTGIGRAQFSTRTADDISRNKDLIVPGGTVELREISMLPKVREHSQMKLKSPHKDEEVGEEIYNFIQTRYGNPLIDKEQSTGIARVMRRLNTDLPANYPAFAEHPVTAQARYMVSQEVAKANANHVYESLAEAATAGQYAAVKGGGMRSLDQSIDEVARTVGLKMADDGTAAAKAVKDNLRQRIADANNARTPGGNWTAQMIDLKQYHVPETVRNRLQRIGDFYNAPEVQKEVSTMFDSFTTVMKGFLLAWPSRFVRDSYSNAFSVWLETGNATDTIQGMYLASKIMAGKLDDDVLQQLAKIPRYAASQTPGQPPNLQMVKQAFLQDAGASGTLSGLSTTDLLSANRSGEISQFVPGATPVSISTGLKELLPNGTRSVRQQLGDFASIRGVSNDFETRNPLLNASQKISDATDSIGRLGGFIALLKQGASPEYAASRMKEALVDYGSMTTLEKSTFKKIFPWWSYSSRIGKYVVQSLMERPGGRYGQTVRSLNVLQKGGAEDGNYIPTSLRQRFAVRIPDEIQPYIGLDPNSGVTPYLTGVGIPGVNELNTIRNGIQPTIAELGNQAHPLLRTIGEMATGQDFFSKRPLSEAVTPVDRIYKALTGSEQRVNPLAKAIIQNIPGTQRLISLGGTLADDRLPMWQRGMKAFFNNTSGGQVQFTDPEYEILDATKKLADDLKPYTKSFVQTYIPEELMPEVPVKAQQKYQLDKDLKKELRAYYQKKREQREFSKQ